MNRIRLLVVVVLAVVSLPGAVAVWAGDAVDIGAVLDDPKTYQMRTLTLRGTVSDHKSETDPSGSFCRQVFRLGEGSRAILVQFISACESQPGGLALLKNGDHVVVEGQLDGKAPPGSVRMHASTVRPADR